MIRVLHMIGNLDIGGSQMMVLNLYKAIDKTQIQFDFVVDSVEKMALAEDVKAMGAKIYVMPKFNGVNVSEIRKSWKNFFLEHPEYKILHSHVRSYASLFVPVAKKQGVKTIVHSHSTSNGKGISSLVKMILQYPLRYQADYFFGCSDKAGEWLFGKKIVQSKKYFCLKNAIDVQKFKYNPQIRQEYRKELKVMDKIVYMHVGRFHPAKNHEFLLRVFYEVKKRKTNAVLVLVGDGEIRSNIEKMITDLGLVDSVILLGNRNDISSLLQAADYFLFPSKWEGFPVTLVEAQASGLPCFVSDTITEEAVITKLARKLPIDNGEECWLNAIVENKMNRKDTSEDIKKSGFDINVTAKWLLVFYERCLYL